MSEPTPLEAKDRFFSPPVRMMGAGFLGSAALLTWRHFGAPNELPWLWWTLISVCGVCALVVLLMLAWRFAQPGRFKLRIDGEGIHDFRQGLHVPWADVRDLRLYDKKAGEGSHVPAVTFHMLLLKVHDPSRYAGGLVGFNKRLTSASWDADFILDLSSLDVSPETVERAARAYWKP